MSSLSGILSRSKHSAPFTRSSIAACRRTTSQCAGSVSGAFKTRSHGNLTDNSTINKSTQDGRQCEHIKSVVPDERNPFIFSRGHWLSHDSARQAARRICFDFPELCKRVVACYAGAKSIASWSKQDGRISRTLVFNTDTGKCVVVRLPTPAAGPAGRAVNSEVATIKYLTSNTDIPVPKILEWREDANNTVGHPYLMMEHATGVSLHDIWPKLRRKWRKRCVKAVCQNLAKTKQLRFSAYGSLYLSNTSSVPSSRKMHIGNNFCIGPQCGPVEQDLYARNAFIPDSGPWSNMAEFADGVVRLGLEGVANRHRISVPDRLYQGTPEQHVDLLNHAHRVLRTAVKDPRVVSDSIPTMLHASPTIHHVFVDPRDPTVVTSITGWQACTISPAFSYWVERTLDVPSNNPDEDVDNIFLQQNEICSQRLWELYPLFRYCHNTWAQGLPVLEQSLNNCARDWHLFNLPGSCPYPSETSEPADERFSRWSEDRIIRYEIDSSLGNVTQDFVENDAWSDIPEKLKKARSNLYESAYKIGLCEYTREMIDASWPYSTDFD